MQFNICMASNLAQLQLHLCLVTNQYFHGHYMCASTYKSTFINVYGLLHFLYIYIFWSVFIMAVGNAFKDVNQKVLAVGEQFD